MLELIKGDLFLHPVVGKTILVHGCNAQGVMNSGVAKVFRQKYPEAFQKYVLDIDYWGKKRALGKVSYYHETDDLTLASAITQEFYGRDPAIRYMSYEAVFDCLVSVMTLYNDREVTIIAPKIGCGLGGGDWNIVQELINFLLKSRTKIKFIVYEL